MPSGTRHGPKRRYGALFDDIHAVHIGMFADRLVAPSPAPPACTISSSPAPPPTDQASKPSSDRSSWASTSTRPGEPIRRSARWSSTACSPCWVRAASPCGNCHDSQAPGADVDTRRRSQAAPRWSTCSTGQRQASSLMGAQAAPRSRASLHGERTHATRGARDQDRLARLHLRDVAQRLQRGEPRRRQRRSLLHREALGHGHDLHRRRGAGPARSCRVGAVVAPKRWGGAGAGCGASRWRSGSSRGSERWAEATNRSGRAYRCCFRISVAPSRTSETWIGPGVRCPRTATNASESAWRRSARCSNPSLRPFELGPRPATAPGRQRGRPRAHAADAPRRPMVQPGTRTAGR